jgi:hypothetical protein
MARMLCQQWTLKSICLQWRATDLALAELKRIGQRAFVTGSRPDQTDPGPTPSEPRKASSPTSSGKGIESCACPAYTIG